MKNFNTLSFETLANIVGGRNNWAANIGGVGGATVAEWALGNAVCGPACGFVGAHYVPIAWAGVTAATGGFGKIRK